MSEKENITKAAGIVGSATLLSRVFGLVRDLVTAYFFGAGMAADAFFVAFRIPNLLRRLLAEGALTVAFVPVFTEYLTKRSRDEAFAMVRAALTLFTIVLTGVTILGILLSPWIITVFAPGFADQPDKFALTVLLTRIMFPYIFLIGLVALAMGVLNSLGKFAAPALAPVFLNIGMIGCIFLLAGRVDPPILSLAVGVIVGGILQVLLQIPYLVKEGRVIGISFDFAHPAIKQIGLLMVPATLGAAVYQFSVFVNTLMASFLPEGSVSYLYYADRVVQFPLGVFAVAIGTAVLPSMSRQAAVNDIKGLRETLSFSLRLIFFISIPSSVGLIILAEPIIRLLFERGEFDSVSTSATAWAMVAYCSGLWALSAVQVVVRAFYSLQDTRTPAVIGAISLVGNVILSVILMFPLKHVGLALASAGGSVINLAILLVLLRRRLKRIDGKNVTLAAARNLAWSAVMGAAAYYIVFGLGSGRPAGMELLVKVVAATIGGGIIYLGLAYVFKASEVYSVIRLVKRRFVP